MEKIPMTPTGFQSLERELGELKSKERPAIIRAIAEARELHPPDGVLAGTHGHHVEMPWVERGDEAPDLALNHMSLQPAVLQVVSQLLRTPVANLRLAQNLVSAKVGRRLEQEGGGEAELEGDQPIHVRPPC